MNVTDWMDRFFDRSSKEISTELTNTLTSFHRKDEIRDKHGLSSFFFKDADTDGVYIRFKQVCLLDEPDEAIKSFAEEEAWFFETIVLRNSQFDLLDLNRHISAQAVNIIVHGECDLMKVIKSLKHVNVEKLMVLDGPIINYDEMLATCNGRRINYINYVVSHRNPIFREFETDHDAQSITKLTIVPVCITDKELIDNEFAINLDGLYNVLKNTYYFHVHLFVKQVNHTGNKNNPYACQIELTKLPLKYTFYSSSSQILDEKESPNITKQYKTYIDEVMKIINFASTILKFREKWINRTLVSGPLIVMMNMKIYIQSRRN